MTWCEPALCRRLTFADLTGLLSYGLKEKTRDGSELTLWVWLVSFGEVDRSKCPCQNYAIYTHLYSRSVRFGQPATMPFESSGSKRSWKSLLGLPRKVRGIPIVQYSEQNRSILNNPENWFYFSQDLLCKTKSSAAHRPSEKSWNHTN